ncbi:MAG: flagellar filament capping protein FliD, partial [Clostridiales bacterium]|nr:flagellar filament capping protein FliD [Clostridiales bacterium]
SDSEAVINGITVKRSTNEYTIDGITYALKKVTQGTVEESVTFTLERDHSATVSSVKKFIEAYNEIYTKLKALVSEEDHSSQYPPLTDAQRAEMTTEQIKAWEQKAKSGLLRQNRELVGLLSDIRSAFYSALGGVGKNATEIGLAAAGYFESNAGQIVLNEEKLTQALKRNPDEVIRMFTNGSSTARGPEQGLIYKLRSSLTAYASNAAKSMETVKDQIKTCGREIGSLEVTLGKLADRYYAKFSRMETALSRLNSQASYISQLFI